MLTRYVRTPYYKKNHFLILSLSQISRREHSQFSQFLEEFREWTKIYLRLELTTTTTIHTILILLLKEIIITLDKKSPFPLLRFSSSCCLLLMFCCCSLSLSLSLSLLDTYHTERLTLLTVTKTEYVITRQSPPIKMRRWMSSIASFPRSKTAILIGGGVGPAAGVQLHSKLVAQVKKIYIRSNVFRYVFCSLYEMFNIDILTLILCS
jgi:hypothetical protein